MCCSSEMGSRIEQLVRAATHAFALKPNGTFLHSANIGEHVHYLKCLANDVSAGDIGLSAERHWKKYDPKSGTPPVSYMGIFENRCVSIGVFILKDGTRIPLHDHQGMYGILKTMYGNLNIQSYTPSDPSAFLNSKLEDRLPDYMEAERHPVVKLTGNDNAIILDPIEKNLHELWSENGPAAFLDILAPPYADDGHNCFYYQEVPERLKSENHCVLRKIPCPLSFWCDSVPYKGPDIQHLHRMQQ